MKRFTITALLTLAGCQFMPGRSSDIRFSPEARQVRGHETVGDFLSLLKKGKVDKALALLSDDAAADWEIRHSLLSKKQQARFLSDIRSDTIVVTEDAGRLWVEGKSLAPTRVKILREKGKWRLEF